MKYRIAYLILFAAAICLSAGNCGGSVDTVSGSCCQTPRSIIVFTDIDVHRIDNEDPQQINCDRMKKIVAPIEHAYLSSDAFCPFTLKVYPLYYKSGEVDPIYIFDKNDIPCNLSRAGRIKILSEFAPVNACKSFQERYCGEHAPTYREIWPSVRLLPESISSAKTDKIAIVYFSDFVEQRAPSDTVRGIFLFAKRNKLNNLYLDCEQIIAARNCMADSSTILGMNVQKYREAIIKAKKNKQVSLFLIKRKNNVKQDNCGERDILDDYWKRFFWTIGFSDDEVFWISEQELESRLVNF